MKDRSLCQAKKAIGYKRRIKPVGEDNDCQMKCCIIPRIYQSMEEKKSLGQINRCMEIKSEHLLACLNGSAGRVVKIHN